MGGIGQNLSLLLKRSPNVKELSLYDIQPVKGLAADLGHIPKPARIIASQSTPEGLAECIKGSDIVVIVAGKPRNPGNPSVNRRWLQRTMFGRYDTC